jgi:hypothetical protein
MDLARAPRRAARKKGSGYENGNKPTRPSQQLTTTRNNHRKRTTTTISNKISVHENTENMLTLI